MRSSGYSGKGTQCWGTSLKIQDQVSLGHWKQVLKLFWSPSYEHTSPWNLSIVLCTQHAKHSFHGHNTIKFKMSPLFLTPSQDQKAFCQPTVPHESSHASAGLLVILSCVVTVFLLPTQLMLFILSPVYFFQFILLLKLVIYSASACSMDF